MNNTIRVEDLYTLRMRLLERVAIDDAAQFAIRDLDAALAQWSLYERVGDAQQAQEEVLNSAFFAAVISLIVKLSRTEQWFTIMNRVLDAMNGNLTTENVFEAIDAGMAAQP